MNVPVPGGPPVRVTALVVAYNHEPYIAQALDSALAQHFDSGYEILVVEDCSTDNTRAIVCEYAKRYPERIRLSLAKVNVGNNAGVLRGIAEARGEYIALLDGDDYWSSPEKIHKQVAHLDARPDHSLCFHAAATLGKDGRMGRFHVPLHRGAISANSLLQGNFIATCSAMFRRALAQDLPPWYVECVFEDWPLYLLLAERGKVGYIDESLGVYRIHEGGAWSGLGTRQKLENARTFYMQMSRWLDGRYGDAIRTGLARCDYGLARWLARSGDRAEARRVARAALRQDPWSLRLRLFLHAPALHDGLLALKERWRPSALRD